MKLFHKVSVGVLTVAFVLAIVGLTAVLAATSPSLGEATSYGVLAGTYTNTSAGTTVTGDIGYTTGPAVAPLGVHANYGSGAPVSTARVDTASALTALTSQPCTFNFADGPIDVSTDGPNGATGVYAPGVYCSNGAMNVGVGGITLSGAGTYIFRAVGALTSTTGSSVAFSGGASVCDVFWTPTAATSLAETSAFAGTVIDNQNAITVGANTTWSGRALSLGAGVVTTGNTSSIIVPSTCAAAPATGGTRRDTTITVVKTVVNDNSGTKTVADFPLFINGVLVTSGVATNFSSPGGVYTVTETANPNYTRTFSGDCDANGHLTLNSGDNKYCIVTNNDVGAPAVPPVPPLIEVVKVPSPLALPGGAGPVTYTYTLRNIGTVPVTDVTMIGDTCSPIVRVSGDTNGDNKLDVNETWVHTCTTTLTVTHTNTVVATGWANGISAVDIASATVVVGAPIVPPLIHITKVPSPLALIAGGGSVTYTKKVTNPGTVALSNVRVVDDKCAPLQYISGDTNGDSMLQNSETWTYTCRMNLTQTTTNTATASGDANGLTARDFAIATVVVAIPRLPSTGIPPQEENVLWSMLIASISLLVATSLVLSFKKRTS